MECKGLKDGDCFYGSCWNKSLKMAFRPKVFLRLFYKLLYYRKKKLRLLLGMTLVGTAATVFLDVPLVILLLMRENYEV
jgi:hypothetical protein